MSQLVPSISLDQIGEEITNNERMIQGTVIEHALRQGSLLAAAWAHCADPDCGITGKSQKNRYGNFSSAKFAELIPTRTALQYRNLFEAFGHLPPETIAKIGMSNCYKLAKQPEEVRLMITQEAETSNVNLTAERVAELLPAEEKPEAIEAPEPVNPKFNNTNGLRPRQLGILKVIELAGHKGVQRTDLIESGAHEWATKKHIDGNMSTLFMRGLIRISDTGSIVVSHDPLGAPVPEEDLNETAKKKLDRAVKQRMRDIDWEISDICQKKAAEFRERHTKSLVDRVEATKTRLVNLKAGGQKLLTPREYKALKMSLHPNGNPSNEVRAEAWAAFQRMGIEPLTDAEVSDIEEQRKMAEEFAQSFRQGA